MNDHTLFLVESIEQGIQGNIHTNKIDKDLKEWAVYSTNAFSTSHILENIDIIVVKTDSIHAVW